MIQLTVTTEKHTSASFVVVSFPYTVGKSASADLQIDAPGAWDRHATFTLRGSKVHVNAEGNAIVLVNGRPEAESLVKSGDVISIGAATLSISLAPARQGGLAAREFATWALVWLVLILQIVAWIVVDLV